MRVRGTRLLRCRTPPPPPLRCRAPKSARLTAKRAAHSHLRCSHALRLYEPTLTHRAQAPTQCMGGFQTFTQNTKKFSPEKARVRVEAMSGKCPRHD